eukprot:symbB.v1.2.035955.t2/scaffold4964.1/size32361/3
MTLRCDVPWRLLQTVLVQRQRHANLGEVKTAAGADRLGLNCEAATLAARRAVKEICDSPNAKVGISADRTSGFRFGTFRERSKDIRHLSSSQGVAALLQMQSPRALSFGRDPATLQAFEPTPRPMTPRKASDIDSSVPMAAYLTEQAASPAVPQNYSLLSSREGSLTRTGSHRREEVDVKPSMAQRAAGATPRLRPVTPREGYTMLPAGRPSLGRTFSENWRGRRHSGRAWSEEPSYIRSPSSTSRYAEQHESTRTWAELMAEAQDLMA